ncbi:MAG TPA: DNA-directed RNA polymerase subunit omega [Thermoanaerobaculaceae bacterium]|nr:DNA-directed RNA polymerase subunit omega [Thermoanaerobaculaceae bacterium]
MPDMPAGVESTFRYILIAARRAEQLIAGARPRVPTRHVKPTTVALDELSVGKVPWHPVTAEEYEALLHQEAALKEKEDLMPTLFPTVPPVIPVVVEAETEADEEEEEEALEDELEGPEFDENLEVVNEAGADELLTEEVPAPEE